MPGCSRRPVRQASRRNRATTPPSAAAVRLRASRAHDLERHQALELGVVGPVDGPHAPLAGGREVHVAAGDHGPQARGRQRAGLGERVGECREALGEGGTEGGRPRAPPGEGCGRGAGGFDDQAVGARHEPEERPRVQVGLLRQRVAQGRLRVLRRPGAPGALDDARGARRLHQALLNGQVGDQEVPQPSQVEHADAPGRRAASYRAGQGR